VSAAVRRATSADQQVLLDLFAAFAREWPPPDYRLDGFDDGRRDVQEALTGGVAALAELDGATVGFALGKLDNPRLGVLGDIYVRPDVRERGIGKLLIAEVVGWARERGADHLEVSVGADNPTAEAIYDRLGFREEKRQLVVELEAIAERVAESEAPPSIASLHAQTDDERSLERAVRQYLPRLGRSRETIMSAARNGWIAIYDELCDRDRDAQIRFGIELSNRVGVALGLALEEGRVVRSLLFERGQLVDEYLSVPEYYGPLDTVDELAHAANATLLARLTGADSAEIKRVARTAASPAELPPAQELLAELARVLGIEGGEHGYRDAPEIPGAMRIEHG
jgi:GNAT superfamily N-acetyltransferase